LYNFVHLEISRVIQSSRNSALDQPCEGGASLSWKDRARITMAARLKLLVRFKQALARPFSLWLFLLPDFSHVEGSKALLWISPERWCL